MLYVVGCGGHGKSVADVLIQLGKNFAFLDKKAKPREQIFGHPVYAGLPEKLETNTFILAQGDNHLREKTVVSHDDWHYVAVIADDAYIGEDTVIEPGAFIAHKAYVGPGCHIGRHTIINTGAIVEHGCQIGDFCHIAPGSTVLGGVSIGRLSFCGGGAVIRNNVCLASDVVVGAGATVIHDLLKGGVYVGTPARLLR